MTRVRVREVLVHLGVETKVLEVLRKEGLFEAEELDADEAEELRVATVLVQELGVNAAGVEVALRLRRRLMALEHRARVLLDAVERDPGPDL
jgi:hypothetical protein